MSDPANPKQTASLLTPAMQTPHESVLLNERRGLLAAVTGNPAFYPGIVDVYDLNEDCRNPALQSSLPVGIFGHESGFAPDGNTFYATSISTGNITAVDLSNPRVPMIVATTNYNSHGLTISDDGNRAYVAASQGLFILDTSEIQARKQGASFKEVSKLDWPERTIPQVAQPITIGGRPYLAEIDEFSSAEDDDSVAANGPKVGAARIIDIADERNPKVVSNIRLAVHQRENRAKIGGDPGAQSFVQGYAGHYCNVPRRDGPGDPRLLDDRERPARSSTSATRATRARWPTSSRRTRPARARASRATTRCRAPRSCPSAARSGTRTATPASTTSSSPAGRSRPTRPAAPRATAPATPASARCRRRRRAAACGWPSRAGARGR